MEIKRCDKCESYRGGRCFLRMWTEGILDPGPREVRADDYCALYEERKSDDPE